MGDRSRREGELLLQTFSLPLVPSSQSPALSFPLRQDLSSPLPQTSLWCRWLRLWWVMFPGDTGCQLGCLHLSRSLPPAETNGAFPEPSSALSERPCSAA